MLRFIARRSKPQLVAPARATPRETKALSGLDDCAYLKHYVGGAEFFRPVRREHEPATDPAKAIRAALAEALVHYYPLAGRLRETPGGRLVVECTGEGAVFVEADADVRLEEFGHPPRPPFPCRQELLCDVDERTPVVDNHLVYMQLTRLRCGGFVLSAHMCHNVVDAFGMIQFIGAIANLARGEARPTVLPVWSRENMFKPRTPPRVRRDIFPGCISAGVSTADTTPPADIVTRIFRFGPKEIATLRSYVPAHLARSCTRFELLTAFMWRCRTVALDYEPGPNGPPVRLVFRMNTRGKYPPIPIGYYGNTVLRPMVEAGVDDLCGKPLGHALELVRKACRLSTTEEHVRSTVDMITALRAHRYLDVDRAFHVCDMTRLGEDGIDMGWAKRVGGGVAYVLDQMSYHLAFRNEDGEVTTLVSSDALLRPTLERLAEEIPMWMTNDAKKIIPSSM
ncbi:unnamed protein product [Triticum turgidum subsp. durum]|uniref:Uncharacterized protein n=1 Tax=Triticum turgidum subsp. durum TaxID=4567 RepID=A0A9R0YF78_TRITD|nr:unnamed protein product [Triticum turgidum subsp. durum]